MLNILSSQATKPNDEFREDPRRGEETNLTWLERNLPTGKDVVSLLLLGGSDPCSFRLRVAQSHVRHDMSPSRWSHIGIVGPVTKNLRSRRLYEISLQPRGGFGFPASTNGVQRNGKLSDYDDSKGFPNLAVLQLPIKLNAVKTALREFERQRVVLDAKELIVHWLAFAWGVGRSGNPLLDGHGIPSAAMVETVVGVSGYDLTPGLESRASCPEAVWQSARWWQAYYKQQKSSPITGSWTGEHRIG